MALGIAPELAKFYCFLLFPTVSRKSKIYFVANFDLVRRKVDSGTAMHVICDLFRFVHYCDGQK